MKYLNFVQKPSVEDGNVTITGTIGDPCYIHRHDEDVIVTIGTGTEYKFCLGSGDNKECYGNEEFEGVLDEENVMYDEEVVKDLFGIMQVVKCAIEGHYREITSYLKGKDDAVAVLCGLDEDILGKIKVDRELIVQGCGCTATSEGKNFPEFEQLIKEMFYLNKAKL
ncbi:MAG: hypothetical protein DRN71_04935 [Candidatus Nanohalarchaeota archaeon]|nr:MAG: hypothetical protein DRN71_04935 [Candidatus Nanohaloarchaeota archaeon]